MMEDEIPQLYVDLVQHPEGLVAECLDIPIVVEAQTVEDIKEKMHFAIKGYFDAFPEKRIEIFNKKRTILKVSMPQ
jgi:hypothetical protein